MYIHSGLLGREMDVAYHRPSARIYNAHHSSARMNREHSGTSSHVADLGMSTFVPFVTTEQEIASYLMPASRQVLHLC